MEKPHCLLIYKIFHTHTKTKYLQEFEIMKAKYLLLSSLLICIPAATFADIVKWVDKNGKVHFGDKVPQEYLDQSKSVEIDHSNFVKNENAEANEKEFKEIEAEAAKIERANLQEAKNARQREIDNNTQRPLPPKPDYSTCSGLPNLAMELRCLHPRN